jgi:hypothetical protein
MGWISYSRAWVSVATSLRARCLRLPLLEAQIWQCLSVVGSPWVDLIRGPGLCLGSMREARGADR